MSQVQINIFGDFVAKDCSPNNVSQKLKDYLAAASINVVNFEAPVNTNGIKSHKSGPLLSQDKNGAAWLESHGFNMITLANNHMMDYGSNGLSETIQSFQKATVIGAGTWEEAYRPAIVEVGGFKIGFLALTHCEFGTLTDKYDDRELAQNGTAWINHPCVDGILIETKKRLII